jgi:hypothetical protein
MLLAEPLAVNKGQYVSGKMEFFANDRFSYNIYITAEIEGTEIRTTSTIYLHDQVREHTTFPYHLPYLCLCLSFSLFLSVS